MELHDAIRSYGLLETEPGRAFAEYETVVTNLYDFAEGLSLPIKFLVVVRNSWYRFDPTRTRAEIDDLRAELEAAPLSYELESLVSRTKPGSLLTDR